MDKSLISISEAAAHAGLSRRRILQMVEDGRMQAVLNGRLYYVTVEDTETLKREQSFLRTGETCRRLKVTRRELVRLIDNGLVTPRNVFSRQALFDPAEIDACLQQVKTSLSIEEAADKLGMSKRRIYRLIQEEKLESVETVYGRRVPTSEINIFIVVWRAASE